MTDPVILYSKPRCVQCNATKRKLDGSNVDYVTIDVTEQPEALAKTKELGYLQAPVVYINDDTHWSGHRPDLLEQHLGVA